MEDLLMAISTVGFPITAFCMMFFLTQTTIKRNTEAINQVKECVLTIHNR